ncbi:MAG TPA: SprT-like domain-containing protein [Gemmatimonadaceae bacterium]|nr:SprT-like domain-containing protein [Gemmatimonadaceae bacterium]
MLRALERLFGFERPREQLSLELDAKPRNAEELCSRLRQFGLDRNFKCRLTSNRSVFVSYRDDELRLHRGYLDAPDETLRAIAIFVSSHSRSARRAARRTLLEYDVHAGKPPAPRIRRTHERSHPADRLMEERLRAAHESLNRERFDGSLSTISIRVSRKMKSRLGHYTHRNPEGGGSEIAISRRHIHRHGWGEAIETLVHEMVHQWQDESGLPVDHGRIFRAKANAVGISPRARRDVA